MGEHILCVVGDEVRDGAQRLEVTVATLHDLINVLQVAVKFTTAGRRDITAVSLFDADFLEYLPLKRLKELPAKAKVKITHKASTAASLPAFTVGRVVDPMPLLPHHGLAKKTGLLSREHSMVDFFAGLRDLALAENERVAIPTLVLNGITGVGKTSFLRHLFNTVRSKGANREAALEAIQSGKKGVLEVVTLFASYDNNSAVNDAEANMYDLEGHLVARLLQSACGSEQYDPTKWSVDHLYLRDLRRFLNLPETTALVLCIDEVAKLKNLSPRSFVQLFDQLMGFCQIELSHGHFVAVVVSSQHYYPVGEELLRRSVKGIRLLPEAAEEWRPLCEAARATTIQRADAPSNVEFLRRLEVAMCSWQQFPSMNLWQEAIMMDTTTSANPPVLSRECILRDCAKLTSDLILDIVAHSLCYRNPFGWQPDDNPCREPYYVRFVKENDLLYHLQNDVFAVIAPRSGYTSVMPVCDISIPVFRLLQFRSSFFLQEGYGGTLASLKSLLFDTDALEPQQQQWESGIPAALHLIALLVNRMATGLTVSFGQILPHTHATFETGILRFAPNTLRVAAVDKLTKDVIAHDGLHMTEPLMDSTVEGLWLGATLNYPDESPAPVAAFFKMKLYTKATTTTLSAWIEAAHERAVDLAPDGHTVVVVMCVPGVNDDDQTLHSLLDSMKAAKNPKNVVILANAALKQLFGVFGATYVTDVIADATSSRKRGREIDLQAVDA